MRTDVCAIEWDGYQLLGVTIDIYCFMFQVEQLDPLSIKTFKAYQHWQDGWCTPSAVNYEPRPDLAQLAYRRAMEHWELYALAYGEHPGNRTAFCLFYDPSQEVFDFRQEIAMLVASLAASLDLNAHLHRSSL